ncbi:MAG TPA: hypothetical protein VHX39_14480 [Acetobacteraceae bacterium]|jgi:hypothetical protein|nr:hypothetical protein [Acetobacteraceae bacterium]
MRRAKTPRPMAAKAAKMPTVVPAAGQLSLDFAGRAAAEVPKVAAQTPAKGTPCRPARRTALGIPEKPKS